METVWLILKKMYFVVLGLHCFAGFSLVAAGGGSSPVVVLGFLIVEASLDTELGL